MKHLSLLLAEWQSSEENPDTHTPLFEFDTLLSHTSLTGILFEVPFYTITDDRGFKIKSNQKSLYRSYTTDLNFNFIKVTKYLTNGAIHSDVSQLQKKHEIIGNPTLGLLLR